MSGLLPNNDFLNDTSSVDKPIKEIQDADKKKRRTHLEVEMEKFPEYYALTDYHKTCLVTNNYWRVMNGEPIIEVPPSDKHYYKYFDNRCYEMSKDYQRKIKMEKQYKENLSKETPTAEIKEVIDSPQIINKKSDKVKEIKKVEPKTESKPELKPESKSVLKPKINPDTKCDFEIEVNPSVVVVESQKKIHKPADKSNDEPQLSLF
jgi:hypothetical protein